MVLSILPKAEDLWGKVKARNKKVPDPPTQCTKPLQTTWNAIW